MISSLATLKGFQPRRNESTAWSPHVPFGYDLVAELRPRVLVELGTHTGQSYFTFCQSVRENAIDTVCYAVDTWKGDPHAGFYAESVWREVDMHNQEHYRAFSYLLRMTFDEARAQFSPGSIGLLHIDGFHSYEAARHDYETWGPLVRPDGIILFHDIAVRRPGYGVWRLWEELARPAASFTFDQGAGLGVLKASPDATFRSEFLNRLFGSEERDRKAILNYYELVADSLRLRRMLGEKTRRRRARRWLEKHFLAPVRGVTRAFAPAPKSGS